MSLATVEDVAEAAKFSDGYLKKLGHTREYALNFWLEHTPEGQHYAAHQWDGATNVFAGSQRLYVEAITDIQEFAFSDAGDRLANVPERPATDDEMDGWLGGMTWRRMELWVDEVTPEEPGIIIPAAQEYVIFAGEKVAVRNVDVVSFDEPDGLNLQQAQLDKWGLQRKGRQRGYRKWPKPIDKLVGKSRRYGTMLFFGHWDVCSSSRKCFRVLLAVKLGSSFGIDGDGVVWWWSDPGFYYGFHGGAANKHAVLSCDFQTPASLKHAKSQAERWGHERPVIRQDKYDRLGRGKGFLGLYKAQIASAFRVLSAMSKRIGLPVSFLMDPEGKPLPRNSLRFGQHHGCATHRDLEDTSKWDVRAWLYQSIVAFQEDAALAAELPEVTAALRIHDPWAQKMRDEFDATCRWPELGIGKAA
jgi:hypothetical protein